MAVMKGLVEIQKGAYWDSLTLDKGQLFFPDQARLFAFPLGASDPWSHANKTAIDTNMHMACMLPAPRTMQVTRILFTFSRGSDDLDIYRFAEGIVSSLVIAQKYYARTPIIAMPVIEPSTAPIRQCDFCRGLFVAAERCPNCGASQFELLSSLGGAPPPGSRIFALTLGEQHAIDILQQQCFEVRLEGTAFTLRERLKVWCHLEGIETRAVQ